MDIDKDKDWLQKMMDDDDDFKDFWTYYQPNEIRFPNRKKATYRLWRDRIPATRDAMLAYVKENSVPKWKNPYFFVQEFPDPDPTFLRGDEGGYIVQVRYGEAFKLCRKETAEQYHLTITKDPW